MTNNDIDNYRILVENFIYGGVAFIALVGFSGLGIFVYFYFKERK